MSNTWTPQGTNLLATPILLDGALTLAAFFSVALDPIGCLTVVVTLLKPHLRDGADNRAMVTVDVTSKAELVRR